MRLFTPATNQWETLPSPESPLTADGTIIADFGSSIAIWEEPLSIEGKVLSGSILDMMNRQWRKMSTVNAPGAGFFMESFLWNGKFVTFGTAKGVKIDGGIYDPATDKWTRIQPFAEHAARLQ